MKNKKITKARKILRRKLEAVTIIELINIWLGKNPKLTAEEILGVFVKNSANYHRAWGVLHGRGLLHDPELDDLMLGFDEGFDKLLASSRGDVI